jgi:hypothetical protein
MIMNKYCNYVRKFMWQLCEWDRVDICIYMIFLIPLHIDLTTFKIARL